LVAADLRARGYIGKHPAAFAAYGNPPTRTVLELGSGGQLAFHLKSKQMTLVDLSADMLAISTQLNPECEHIKQT
jgi:hypothetical protein